MAERGGWQIQFYFDSRGRAPVMEYIDDLPKAERADAIQAIDLLWDAGVYLMAPHSRQVEGRLWELKAGQTRIFYFAAIGRRFFLLHAFKKQSQKTPRREIETATRRMNDLIERERQ